MIIIKDISWSGCTRKDKALKKEEKKSKWFHTQSASGQVGLVAAHNLIQSSQQERNWLTELSLHCQRNCTICISKQELKVWAFCVCVFCFCVGFFIFVLFSFWFSITWNVWKLFNLNVGKKQVRHYFCTKLAFLIVQMNLVPLINGERS